MFNRNIYYLIILKLHTCIVFYQFFVGKKFVGYTMFDNNYGGKMRKMSKTVPKIDNYERVSLSYIKIIQVT